MARGGNGAAAGAAGLGGLAVCRGWRRPGPASMISWARSRWSAPRAISRSPGSPAGAAGLGARVALIERHLMGGDCLNVGCVPSKAVIAGGWTSFSVRPGSPPRISNTHPEPRTRRRAAAWHKEVRGGSLSRACDRQAGPVPSSARAQRPQWNAGWWGGSRGLAADPPAVMSQRERRTHVDLLYRSTACRAGTVHSTVTVPDITARPCTVQI